MGSTILSRPMVGHGLRALLAFGVFAGIFAVSANGAGINFSFDLDRVTRYSLVDRPESVVKPAPFPPFNAAAHAPPVNAGAGDIYESFGAYVSDTGTLFRLDQIPDEHTFGADTSETAGANFLAPATEMRIFGRDLGPSTAEGSTNLLVVDLFTGDLSPMIPAGATAPDGGAIIGWGMFTGFDGQNVTNPINILMPHTYSILSSGIKFFNSDGGFQLFTDGVEVFDTFSLVVDSSVPPDGGLGGFGAIALNAPVDGDDIVGVRLQFDIEADGPVIPEPSAFLLLVVGAVTMIPALRRRRRR